jgi:hypothetical protein
MEAYDRDFARGHEETRPSPASDLSFAFPRRHTVCQLVRHGGISLYATCPCSDNAGESGLDLSPNFSGPTPI